jgi:hypothetical protein
MCCKLTATKRLELFVMRRQIDMQSDTATENWWGMICEEVEGKHGAYSCFCVSGSTEVNIGHFYWSSWQLEDLENRINVYEVRNWTGLRCQETFCVQTCTEPNYKLLFLKSFQ